MVKHPTLDFSLGHDLRSLGIQSHVRLHTEHGPCLGFSLSLSLCLSYPSPSLKKRKKRQKTKKETLVYIELNLQIKLGSIILFTTFSLYI